MSITLRAELPEDLQAALEVAGYTSERLAEEARRHLGAALFARKALSVEQAARLAGMSLWDFIPFLGQQAIPVADYDEEEVARELETSRWLSRRREE